MKGQYQRELLDKIRRALTNYGGTGGRPITVSSLWLGGVSGEDGGSGGPPGMFIGKLPQTKVCHDTTEAEVAGGSTSLLDNLNAMRLMAKRYAFMVAGDMDEQTILAIVDDAIGEIASATWIGLPDTPANYSGKAGYVPNVTDEEDGIELESLSSMISESKPSCRVYKNSNTTLASFGTWETLSFNTERHDTGGMWTSGSPTRITVPSGEGGVYTIGGSIVLNTNLLTGQGGEAGMRIRLNGSTIIAQYFREEVAGGDTVQYNAALPPLTTVRSLSAGDYLEFRAYADWGTHVYDDVKEAKIVLYVAQYSPVFWAAKL